VRKRSVPPNSKPKPEAQSFTNSNPNQYIPTKTFYPTPNRSQHVPTGSAPLYPTPKRSQHTPTESAAFHPTPNPNRKRRASPTPNPNQYIRTKTFYPNSKPKPIHSDQNVLPNSKSKPTHSDRKRRASALRTKRHAEGVTALPKAGVKAQPERLNCLLRCHPYNPIPQPILPNYPHHHRLYLQSTPSRSEQPSRSYPLFIPVFTLPLSPLSAAVLSKPRPLQANPHPQTIFHAFTQQNRMSSPPTHPKTNNPNPISKIKLSPKRFLVMVNPVQLT
jgi:hypothetical protein